MDTKCNLCSKIIRDIMGWGYDASDSVYELEVLQPYGANTVFCLLMREAFEFELLYKTIM